MHAAVTDVQASGARASLYQVEALRRRAAAPRAVSAFERRIADGTYTADAHALARSFLEYFEHLAGPA